MADIKIVIGGEIRELEAKLNEAKARLASFSKDGGQSIFNLTEKLKQLEANVFTEKSRARVIAYNKEISLTKIEIEKLSNAGKVGFDNLGNATAKTGNALGAVYGKARILANILPGIGIAGIFGLAATAIYEAAGALGLFTTKLSEQEEQRKLLVALEAEASKSAGKEAADLLVLKSAIESASVPMATRLQAIKDLKKEFPGLFDGLTKEQLLTGNVGDAYDKATAAILRKARANAAAKQLEEIAAKKFAILQKSLDDKDAAVQNVGKAQPERQDLPEGGGFETMTTEQVQKQIIKRANIRAAAAQQEIDDLNHQQEFLLQFVIEGADRTIEVEKEKVKKLKKIREEYLKYLGTPNLKVEDSFLTDFQKEFAERLKKLAPPTDQAGNTITIKVTPKFEVDPKGLENFLKQIALDQKFQSLTDEINKIISSTLASGLGNLGEALGQAIGSGQDPIAAAFRAILGTITSGLKAIGQAMIEFGIAKTLLSKLRAVPGTTLIIAGIALELAAGLLQGAFAKSTQGFATGTRSFGGTAIVGERGPELITLPQGSSVTPNAQLNAMGNNSMQVTGRIVAQGTELVVIIDRARALNSRNG